MRRKDREVTDPREIEAIIDRCDVCRLALNTPEGYPYILPLNFGWEWKQDSLTLYFHSALEGRKFELMDADPRASFEMDCGHELLSVEARGYCTMNYESVVGHGRLEYVTEPDEMVSALTLMTDRYHTEHFVFNPAALPRTRVYRLKVEALTAKRKASKP